MQLAVTVCLWNARSIKRLPFRCRRHENPRLATRANGRVGRVNGAINHTSEIVYGDRHNFLHNKRATVRLDTALSVPGGGWVGGSEASRCGAALIGHF